MGPQTETASARSDARAHRRWLIGIGITVAFGLFGAVMALLAYTNGRNAPRSSGPATTAPATTTPATTSPAPSSPDPTRSPPPDEPGGKGHGKDHGRK